MKIIKIIVFLTLLILIGVGCIIIINKEKKSEIISLSDEEIIQLLKKNKDSLEYMEKNKDFKIEKKIVLTGKSILEGREGENFKEVYQDLFLEDNRYLQVDLMNTTGDRGLITVLDLITKEVSKAYGLILIKGGVKVE